LLFDDTFRLNQLLLIESFYELTLIGIIIARCMALPAGRQVVIHFLNRFTILWERLFFLGLVFEEVPSQLTP